MVILTNIFRVIINKPSQENFDNTFIEYIKKNGQKNLLLFSFLIKNFKNIS